MNPAEIVLREMQRHCRLEIRQLLTEGVGQPGQSAAHHADCQILPLHIGSADMLRIGIAIDRRGYHLRDSCEEHSEGTLAIAAIYPRTERTPTM